MSEDDKLSWLKSGLAIRVAAEVDKRGVTTWSEIRHIAEAFERKDAMKKVAGIQEQMDEVERVSTAAVARKKEIQCFKCGEKGHIARNCRVVKKRDQFAGSVEDRDTQSGNAIKWLVSGSRVQ